MWIVINAHIKCMANTLLRMQCVICFFTVIFRWHLKRAQTSHRFQFDSIIIIKYKCKSKTHATPCHKSFQFSIKYDSMYRFCRKSNNWNRKIKNWNWSMLLVRTTLCHVTTEQWTLKGCQSFVVVIIPNAPQLSIKIVN